MNVHWHMRFTLSLVPISGGLPGLYAPGVRDWLGTREEDSADGFGKVVCAVRLVKIEKSLRVLRVSACIGPAHAEAQRRGDTYILSVKGRPVACYPCPSVGYSSAHATGRPRSQAARGSLMPPGARRPSPVGTSRRSARAYGLWINNPLQPAQAGFAFHSRGLQPHGKGRIADLFLNLHQPAVSACGRDARAPFKFIGARASGAHAGGDARAPRTLRPGPAGASRRSARAYGL